MQRSKTEILIISYFFKPDKRVGALRTSYWFQELNKLKEFNVEVVTANEESLFDRVHVVKNTEQNSNKFTLIKDVGQSWKLDVKLYLKNKYKNKPVVVIISGSPFMHFGLTKWIKKEFGCKVILDYRDPFAINPGFKNSKLKIAIKTYYENKFNNSADALVTVNKYCAEIIAEFSNKQNAIIQNGYDETVVPINKPIDLKAPSLAYTGKFYFDPTPIVEALSEMNLKMNYAGPDDSQLKNAESIVNHGFVDYKSAVDLIAQNDIGVIQTYGEDFQSTTKLFDYIRCKKVILIVSANFIERGSLHEELLHYPNVFWTKNDKINIMKVLEEIKNANYVEPDSDFCDSFSRHKQMQKLIGLINNLTH